MSKRWNVPIMIACLGMVFWGSCKSSDSHSTDPTKSTTSKSSMQPSTPSGEFKEFRGLFDRDAAGEIVDAQPVDASLARTYPSFEPKGHAVAGRRITLMAPRGPFQVGEEVRVLHFYESTHSGDELHIMGPKHVYGEYVDGISAEPEPPTPEYPWMLVYDGTILPSPEVDYNFEISKYRFDSPGKHTLQWRISGLESNVLEIEVK